ncbi:histidine kinase [Amycolatopsis antarctica]|nr:histidine kinase [Amycolatopsis antarctica]
MQPDSPPQTWSGREATLDVAVALAVAGLVWALPLFLPDGEPELGPLAGTLGFLVVGVATLASRVRGFGGPLAVAGTAAVALTAWTLIAPGTLATADDPLNLLMPLAPFFPQYAAHLYFRNRRHAWVLTALLAVIAVRPWPGSVAVAAAGLLYVSVPMLFGLYLSARDQLVATLTERAERAELERDLGSEHARREERTRLATDLHDIVTHRISLMVLHAGALGITAAERATRDAAETVRATGCTALEELRDLIGLLRKAPSAGRQERPPACAPPPAATARGERQVAPPPIGRPDVLLAAAAFAVTVLITVVFALEPSFGGGVPWPWVAVQLPVAAVLVLRRRYPQIVLAVSIADSLLMLWIAYTGPDAAPAGADSATLLIPMATPLVTFAAAAHSRRPRLAAALVLTLLVLAARPWDPYLSVAMIAAVFAGAPALLGMYAGARRRLIAALTERAARAKREERLLAERARAAERAELAGEMHGIVARRLHDMLARAGRLGSETDSAATRDAAAELTANGRQALTELDALVRALRSPQPDDDVPGGGADDSGADLGRLAADSASVGVPVELDLRGDPATLSPTVARTVYRVVGEALTNIRKHAHGAQVAVRVTYEAERVRVAVRNGRPPASTTSPHRHDPDLATGGSGTGLLGVRRRVELVDGTFEAGATADGGFAVGATLPVYVPTSMAASTPNSPEEPSR